MRYILRTLIRLLFNLIAHVEASGYEYLPEEGNFVIATNHLGIIDAPMAFYALDRWDLFVLVGEKWKKRSLMRQSLQQRRRSARPKKKSIAV